MSHVLGGERLHAAPDLAGQPPVRFDLEGPGVALRRRSRAGREVEELPMTARPAAAATWDVVRGAAAQPGGASQASSR